MRSPGRRLYSENGWLDAPTNRPWLGITIPACADWRQNWYTTSVLDPQHGPVVTTPLATEIGRGQLLEARVDGPFQAAGLRRQRKREARVAEREVRSLLIGERAVIDHVAREIILPCSDDEEQQVGL